MYIGTKKFLEELGILDYSKEQKIIKKQMKLSEHETTILEKKISGKSIEEIRKDMNLAEQTIKNHLNKIYLKLGIEMSFRDIRAARKLLIEEAYENYKKKLAKS